MEKEIEISVIRSRRKTMSLEITRDAQVILRVPMDTRKREINQFVEEKADWFSKHYLEAKRKAAERKSCPPVYLTEAELAQLKTAAETEFPQLVSQYARRLGVRWNQISYRCQKTRWGSCSGRGNLSFNILLMLAPAEVREYVALHEVCHLREMNHSGRFWKLVEAQMPDYAVRKKWLKDHGEELMDRVKRD